MQEQQGPGMMGGMCPMCRRMMGMEQEQEEGPYRGMGPARRSDDQIMTEAEEVLTDDSWVDASGIQVQAENGVVTLTGTVESREMKRRAEDLIDQTCRTA